MKKTLTETFDFMESIGWDVTVLDENYKGKTVYGISKPLDDDDIICILAPFSDTATSVDIHNRITAYYEYESTKWEREDLRDLLVAIERFTKE